MREELNNAMKNINNANDNLAEALMLLPSIYSEYYDLPRVLKEEESQEINHYPDVIPIESVYSGDDAEMGALAAMLNVFGQVGYSTRIATRHPGILCKQASDNECVEINRLIVAVNGARAHFVAVAHREKDKNIRFEVVHEMFPMLIMRNMQREIECVRDPVKYYLGWGNKPIVTRPDLKYIETKLEGDMDKEPPEFMTRSEWVRHVKKELFSLKNVSRFDKIRMRRPVKSQAIATIDGCSKVCPIPKIVLMSDARMPLFKRLCGFDKSKSKPRGKRVEWRPVVDRYHVYSVMR